MSNNPIVKTDNTGLPLVTPDSSAIPTVPNMETNPPIVPEEPEYVPQPEVSLVKPQPENKLLSDSSIDASNFLTGQEGVPSPDQSLGLTSTLQAIERKEQPILTYTDQGVQASLAQQQSQQTATNQPQASNNNSLQTAQPTPKQQLFTRILNTLIGYKVTATAVKEYNSWAQQDPKNSNTWLGIWIRMIGEKIDKIL
ncbi:MAG TPA: hypothetical protein PK957_00085 [Candidatus Dojkabacteria bacterium]|nr:hypothetical protein [Candidatus Dojkabacteria bacterium]HQF36181.1 hypothetical protein [Candidatus Dojkabacteria bacterium]